MLTVSFQTPRLISTLNIGVNGESPPVTGDFPVQRASKTEKLPLDGMETMILPKWTCIYDYPAGRSPCNGSLWSW